MDAAAMEREALEHLEEIRHLGLVDRALEEFASRLPDAVVAEWRIGYFVTKEVVGCEFWYTLDPEREVQQAGLSFRKTADDQWGLQWDGPGRDDRPRTPHSFHGIGFDAVAPLRPEAVAALETAERALGSLFPSDYREFALSFGPGEFEELSIVVPSPSHIVRETPNDRARLRKYWFWNDSPRRLESGASHRVDCLLW